MSLPKVTENRALLDRASAVASLQSVEVSAKGKWQQVPALHVNGYAIIVKDGWFRRAIVHDEEWLETALEDPEGCIELLKSPVGRALRGDIFTFAQRVPDTAPKFPYTMVLESIAVCHVTSYKDWWGALPQESRKNVRRAEKRGVAVSVRQLDDELVRGIVEVNNDSPIRQGVPFVHHGKTHEQVRKDQSSWLKQSDFICAYLGDEMIGFLKLVYGRETASVLQLLSKASRYDVRSTNALIAKAVEQCAERKIPYFIYGQYSYGNRGATSLREFKARNGFKEVLVPRYYVPLTVRGRVGMTLGLHQGLVGILPERAVSLGVTIRSKWYDFRLSSGRCSSTSERPKL
jgi:hypothetical protein